MSNTPPTQTLGQMTVAALVASADSEARGLMDHLRKDRSDPAEFDRWTRAYVTSIRSRLIVAGLKLEEGSGGVEAALDSIAADLDGAAITFDHDGINAQAAADDRAADETARLAAEYLAAELAGAASLTPSEARTLAMIQTGGPIEAKDLPAVRAGRFNIRTFEQQGLIAIGQGSTFGWMLSAKGERVLRAWEVSRGIEA